MSNFKLRVEIAKDVLKHIKLNSFEVQSGAYFHTSSGRVAHILNRDGKGSRPFNELIENTNDCQVCAKGALMYSHIVKNKDVPASKWSQISKGQNYEMILTCFTARMIAEIETLFEGKVFSWNRDYFTDEEEDAILKYRKEEGYGSFSDEDRLTAIMQTLIETKGEKVWQP